MENRTHTTIEIGNVKLADHQAIHDLILGFTFDRPLHIDFIDRYGDAMGSTYYTERPDRQEVDSMIRHFSDGHDADLCYLLFKWMKLNVPDPNEPEVLWNDLWND